MRSGLLLIFEKPEPSAQERHAVKEVHGQPGG